MHGASGVRPQNHGVFDMKSYKLLTIGLIGIVACGRCSAQPSWKLIPNQLNLPDKSTLVYQVIEKNMTPPQVRTSFLNSQREQNIRMVKSGQTTQAEADASLASLEKAMKKPDAPPEKHTITLSAIKGKLFYRQKSKDDDHVMIYDGKMTWEYIGKEQRALIRPGFGFADMHGFPLPAAGLPLVPLIKNSPSQANREGDRWLFQGECPMIDIWFTPPQKLVHRPAEISARQEQNKIKLLGILYKMEGDVPIQQWEYLKHRKFANMWLASQMRHTQYHSPAQSSAQPPGKDSTTVTPSRIYEYSLLEAKTTGLPSESFNLLTWLKPATVVTDHRDPKQTGFTYYPGTGTLEAQRNAARYLQDHAFDSVQRGNVPRNAASGVYLLMSLACIMGWFWWKRKKSLA